MDINNLKNSVVDAQLLASIKKMAELTQNVEIIDCNDDISNAQFVFGVHCLENIPDPLDNKKDYLKNILEKMQPGAYFCIADTFILDTAISRSDQSVISKQWERRGFHVYCGTTIDSLNSLDFDDIQSSKQAGKNKGVAEKKLGASIVKREQKYPVQPAWLSRNALAAGFETIFEAQINACGDYIFLLRKPLVY